MTFAEAGVDVALRDGRTVRVRPVRADDADRLQAFLEALPERDRYFRFFSTAINLKATARRMAEQAGGLGLVALAGADEEIVGHAAYICETPTSAEVAFAVSPAYQAHGLATTMMADLAEAAAGEGVDTFTAVVIAENHRMTNVFRHSGFPVEVRAMPGEIEVTFATEPTEDGRARFARRERDAAVAAVRPVLEPERVVFVAEGAVPPGTDLAIVAQPPGELLGAVRRCAQAQARAVLVSTPVRDPSTLLRVCRDAGMRLVGPDSLGVVNTRCGLFAVPSLEQPPAGRVAFASQGGAFGLVAMEAARRRGVGFSSFVSLGAKADLSGNDFLQFWEQDPDTDVVLLYLESFGNPGKFGRITRRLTATKPVVALKSGRTGAARGPSGSRSGALLTAADTSVDALFEHAGVIRADTPGEMLDVAGVLTHEPLPAGHRVAVVANAAGPGTMCADALAASGLEVARVATVAATASPSVMAAALAEEADAVIAVHVRTPGADGEAVVAALRAQALPVPVLAAFIGETVSPPAADGGRVPVFESAEEAARALAHVTGYAAHLRARRAEADAAVPELPPHVDGDRAAAIVAARLADGGGWMEAPAVEALLESYGIALAPSRTARTPWAAARAAAELGFPVAIKGIAPGLVHKTEAGAVELDVRSAAAAQRVAGRLRDRLRAAGTPPAGFLVQRMAPPGPELIVGAVGDPQFGPLVVAGAGGPAAELVGDVAVRLAPVDRAEAERMVRGLRTFPLLDGFRGAPKVDVDAVVDVVVRIAALAAAHPEVVELDCDPLIAGVGGAVVADARVRVAAAPGRRPFGALDR